MHPINNGFSGSGTAFNSQWRFTAPKAIKHPAQPLDHHNLFVAGLAHSCTDAHLMELFAPFKPLKAAVMMDVMTGRSKRFAFVLFSSEEDGRAAVAAFHGQTVQMPCGKMSWLHVNPSKYDGFAAARENEGVYVRNVPPMVTATQLASFYSQFGVVQALEMRPGPNNSNLVALRFDTVTAARAAIEATHGKHLFQHHCDDGFVMPPPLMAKFADPPRDAAAAPPLLTHGPKSGGISLSAMPTLQLFDILPPALDNKQTPRDNINSGPPSNGSRTPVLRSSTPTSQLDEAAVPSLPSPRRDYFSSSCGDGDSSLTGTPEAATLQPQPSCGVRYRNDPYSFHGITLVKASSVAQ